MPLNLFRLLRWRRFCKKSFGVVLPYWLSRERNVELNWKLHSGPEGELYRVTVFGDQVLVYESRDLEALAAHLEDGPK
ncbi:MAG: hypothetical protein IJ228_06750 [Succinivibrio sp.]|nr:hypothetical protein [Succinivibrio sp.]